MKNFLTFLIFLGLLFMSLYSFADDSAYKKAKLKLFWPLLYNSDYETLYCGVKKEAGEAVAVEHVYPASWIASSLGCKNRRNCDEDKYRAASSDLHNLWPALGRYNSSRGNNQFGEIPGEKKRFKEDDCDFERTSGKYALVEPRDEVKGVIARSYLYMIHRYDLPQHDLLPLMVKWHIKYPVSEIEVLRNKKIELLQENLNPFVGVD